MFYFYLAVLRQASVRHGPPLVYIIKEEGLFAMFVRLKTSLFRLLTYFPILFIVLELLFLSIFTLGWAIFILHQVGPPSS